MHIRWQPGQRGYGRAAKSRSQETPHGLITRVLHRQPLLRRGREIQTAAAARGAALPPGVRSHRIAPHRPPQPAADWAPRPSQGRRERTEGFSVPRQTGQRSRARGAAQSRHGRARTATAAAQSVLRYFYRNARLSSRRRTRLAPTPRYGWGLRPALLARLQPEAAPSPDPVRAPAALGRLPPLSSPPIIPSRPQVTAGHGASLARTEGALRSRLQLRANQRGPAARSRPTERSGPPHLPPPTTSAPTWRCSWKRIGSIWAMAAAAGWGSRPGPDRRRASAGCRRRGEAAPQWRNGPQRERRAAALRKLPPPAEGYRRGRKRPGLTCRALPALRGRIPPCFVTHTPQRQ